MVLIGSHLFSNLIASRGENNCHSGYIFSKYVLHILATNMTTNPTSSVIAENLCAFIRKNLVADGVEVKHTTPLLRLGLDSFSLIEIVLFVERQYGLELPDEALNQENIYSSETLASYIYQCQ